MHFISIQVVAMETSVSPARLTYIITFNTIYCSFPLIYVKWGLEPQWKCIFLVFNYIYCECCVHYMVIAHQGGCLELMFSNIGLFVKRTTKSC